LNPNYAYPYMSIEWPYPLYSCCPPHYARWNWFSYVYGMPQHTRNDWSFPIQLKDYGGKPFVVDIEKAAEQNQNYRTALWTGKHLQVTLMSIEPGGDIGLEVHPDADQFIRIEQGQGLVQMGERRDRLDFARRVSDDDAIMIPAGTWHNVTNTGRVPLKLYSIYAPPEHPFGTVHRTKAEAIAAERKLTTS